MFATKLMLVPVMGMTLLAFGGADKKADKSANDRAFENLKKLVGDWVQANPKTEAEKSVVALRYRLIAADSVLIETYFPGTDKEMVTMYHRDGDQLVLTHYCMCGNQPRMRARAGAAANEVVFDFDGGTNINPAKGFHMHDALIRFVDNDHFHSEWEYFVDGKAGGKHSFDLIRKK